MITALIVLLSILFLLWPEIERTNHNLKNILQHTLRHAQTTPVLFVR